MECRGSDFIFIENWKKWTGLQEGWGHLPGALANPEDEATCNSFLLPWLSQAEELSNGTLYFWRLEGVVHMG